MSSPRVCNFAIQNLVIHGSQYLALDDFDRLHFNVMEMLPPGFLLKSVLFFLSEHR